MRLSSDTPVAEFDASDSVVEAERPGVKVCVYAVEGGGFAFELSGCVENAGLFVGPGDAPFPTVEAARDAADDLEAEVSEFPYDFCGEPGYPR